MKSQFDRSAMLIGMKRKVADGMSGNFRGVCPILNRATRNDDTVCGGSAQQVRSVVTNTLGLRIAQTEP